jgi:hypothetical protein
MERIARMASSVPTSTQSARSQTGTGRSRKPAGEEGDGTVV